MSIPTKNKHCVIIGASIAGSLAAYALAPYFESVKVIEQSPVLGQLRKGLGHGHQFHIYLIRGQRGLEKLIPGIFEEFNKQQCPLIQIPNDLFWITDFGPINHPVTPLSQIHLMDRLMLERILIDRLLKDRKNVSLELGESFRDFEWDDSERRVTGVRCTRKGETLEHPADLTVVCGGRGFDLDKLLHDKGALLPPTRKVPADFVYVSQRIYTEEKFPWSLRYKQCNPPHSYSGAVIAKVHNRGEYVFMVGGMKKHYPQATAKGLRSFLSDFPDPVFLQVLESSEVLVPPSIYRIDGSFHRPMGQTKNWPSGLIALGDAVCSFNPVYGQGLSVATMEVEALADMFEKKKYLKPAWEHRFQRKVDAIVREPWLLATGEDSRLYSKKDASWIARFSGWYMQNYLRASTRNASMALDFVKVSHLIKSPRSLLHPKHLLKVLASLPESRAQSPCSDLPSPSQEPT